ncbi:uncharacterized protein RAG0_06322 [Rhynchosporium agropyri]|uniref:Uncharacterized protein n=1 Tax=Rhynchosporium agropyri TaxID=914238 RepID=A0A1E1KGJ5_9HELO|nr:uncharacterized protein RAG0_06322 [Rhynchosporium agropyri]
MRSGFGCIFIYDFSPLPKYTKSIKYYVQERILTYAPYRKKERLSSKRSSSRSIEYSKKVDKLELELKLNVEQEHIFAIISTKVLKKKKKKKKKTLALILSSISSLIVVSNIIAILYSYSINILIAKSNYETIEALESRSYLEANKASAERIRLLFDILVIKINYNKTFSSSSSSLFSLLLLLPLDAYSSELNQLLKAELLISTLVGLLLALYVAYYSLINRLVVSNFQLYNLYNNLQKRRREYNRFSTSTSTIASTIAITESIVSSVDLVAVLLVLIFRAILASYTSAEGSRIKSFKKK